MMIRIHLGPELHVLEASLARLIVTLLLMATFAAALDEKKTKQENKSEEPIKAEHFAGITVRLLGPALNSGRISDFAVVPNNPSTYYVAVASGGVWKTQNAGTTFSPVFDSQGSYSIGCVTLDPHNSEVVWVGTGENNSQRSVGYGDGVYKSVDGGKSWTNMGLKQSEHIGMIAIDPRNSDRVFVAAQGPLWSSKGERGLYLSEDGGKTWKAVLEIDIHTGVSEISMDPSDPDTMVAVSYQRRRHVWTVVNGGPGSGLHKSTDGGKTWRKLSRGLPSGELGRIGITRAATKPNLLYAIVETSDDSGGFFRSTDGGESWEKRNGYVSSSGQYYQELFLDPNNPNRIFSMDVFMKVSEDGGASWKNVGERWKHVDNHALWIDPRDSRHLLSGNDGGIYESFDMGANWLMKTNLPVTQFYKISTDQAEPFYNVYGGTQDNLSIGGPSRTVFSHGISTEEWFVTSSGDGFETQVDPTNHQIIYSQAQHGALYRYDRKSGEAVYIQAKPAPGEPGLRWNWDAPLLLSPHSPTRIYHAANRLYRSDDRGNSWQPVSPDLSRQLDRDSLPVMDKIQRVDAIAKNKSTSAYGNIVALSESPKQEGLLYVGTDDGLIQVSSDGGSTWKKFEKFPDVPDMTYVNALFASQHETDRVYAAFNNHKRGDFKPYLLVSHDRGASWKKIANNLPERGSVYCVVEDPYKANLLFAGTEFGLFISLNGGGHWIPFKNGLPTVAVRDLEIQKRESDLVIGTFGRGIYVLDDISFLRGMDENLVKQDAKLFQPRDSWSFVFAHRFGFPEKGFAGAGYYTAENPPYGAGFTYYLKDELKTLKKARHEAEEAAEKEGKTPPYPKAEVLKAEANEEAPAIFLAIQSEEGKLLRLLEASGNAGLNRVYWDLRLPIPHPVVLNRTKSEIAWISDPIGPLVVPGTYRAQLMKRSKGQMAPIAEAVSFKVKALGNTTFPAKDRREQFGFQTEVAELFRAVSGASELLDELKSKIDLLKKAVDETPEVSHELEAKVRELEAETRELMDQLNGDATLAKYQYTLPPTISEWVGELTGAWDSTADPTQTQRDSLTWAKEAFIKLNAQLRKLAAEKIPAFENQLESAGAPYTKGRIPLLRK